MAEVPGWPAGHVSLVLVRAHVLRFQESAGVGLVAVVSVHHFGCFDSEVRAIRAAVDRASAHASLSPFDKL